MSSVTQQLRFRGAIAALVVSAWAGSVTASAATNSSPIAITSDDHFVWSVNRDDDSVSVFNVSNDVNTLVVKIKVGDEPRCVAITPDNKKVYVTNAGSGTVSVIDASAINPNDWQVIKTIKVGTEPMGCAMSTSPGVWTLFVANFGSDTVSAIDTNRDRVQLTIKKVGPKPRGVAVTNDSKVYITQFLAQLRDDARPVTEKEGVDDGKEGRVTVLSSTYPYQRLGTVILNPLADTGFKSRGQTLTATGPVLFDSGTQTPQVVTGAFPNLLQSIVVRGNRAYLPNTCSSPNGPVRFNVNVQSCLSVFDTTTNLDSNQTINMNSGVQFEAVGRRLFNTNPIAIAFEHSGDEGWVVSAATNRIVRVQVDGNGQPTINAPTGAGAPGTGVGDPAGILRLEVGKNPQGIVINSTDTRAYVMNFISRDVSVINLSANPPVKLTDIASAALPAAGSQEAKVHLGNELFNTSIGPEGTNENALRPAGRMSDFGWGTCYSCHPDGLHDGVTWMFTDGPRQTISMESTFAHPQPPGALTNANGAPLLPSSHQRMLNWSAVRDEVQDFELNIRNVSGGQGLIRDGLAVVNFTPTANTGRDADLDAITAYIAFGIRAPISPEKGKALAGRKAFEAAHCQNCHGGVNWTISQVDYTPPPAGTETITDGQFVRFLKSVNTFDGLAFNEFKAGIANNGQINNARANGALGFNPPSLLSVFAGAPYLHSGACPTLECVLENIDHRKAGTGVDTLSSPAKRKQLIKFLRRIDADTEPFN